MMSAQMLAKLVILGGVGYIGYRVYQSYSTGQGINLAAPVDLTSLFTGDTSVSTDTSNDPSGVVDTSTDSGDTSSQSPAPLMPSVPIHLLAWGAKVSDTFRQRVAWIGQQLNFDPSWLMSVIAFESGGTFSSNVRNPYSGFVGLIQFGPAAASQVGSSMDELAAMSPEDQLNYVYKYLAPYAGRYTSLADTYMAVLHPASIGQPSNSVVFAAPSTAYTQNSGLDTSIPKDGIVTKAEAAAPVQLKYAIGMAPGNVWVG